MIDFAQLKEAVKSRLDERLQNRDQASAPFGGSMTVPHIVSFQGLMTTMSRIYRITDVALKESFDNAKFMRNNLTVMEPLEHRKRAVALLGWHLQPQDETNKKQVEAARIITQILCDIPHFTQFKECLLEAVWYGKYGVQMQYMRKLVLGKPVVSIQRWLPLNGDKIVYRLEEGRPYEQEQVGIRVGYHYDHMSEQFQRQIEPADIGYAIFLSPEQRKTFAIHRHMVEDGDYDDPMSGGRIHGVGIRSRIYYTYYLMQEALAWLMEFLERSATGFEIWYYPSGNEQQRKKTEEAAKNRLGNSNNIVLVPRPSGPDGYNYNIQRIEPSMNGANVLIDILGTYFGHTIKRYILGQTLTTEAQSTGLGSGLANIHLDTFLQIVKYDAINLSETITRDVIQPLVQFSFPSIPEDALRFVLETESQDPENKLRAANIAYQMGAGLSESEILGLAGLNRPTIDETELRIPRASLQQGVQNGRYNNPVPKTQKQPDEDSMVSPPKIFAPNAPTSPNEPSTAYL